MAVPRKGKQRKKEQSEYFFDYSLLFIVLFLLGFGLVMIYSASSYNAFEEFEDTAYYLKKQLVAVIVGLVAMIVAANFDYRRLAYLATLGYVGSALLIPAVLSPLGNPTAQNDGSVFPASALTCSLQKWQRWE